MFRFNDDLRLVNYSPRFMAPCDPTNHADYDDFILQDSNNEAKAENQNLRQLMTLMNNQNEL